MSTKGASDEALSVEVFDGEVVIRSVDGPVGLSLTPRAAAETAQKLALAADQAAPQPSHKDGSRD